jgi:hypothetical protein
LIEIEWRAPQRNSDGSPEVELKEAEVLRRVVDLAALAASTTTPSEEAETPDTAEPQAEQQGTEEPETEPKTPDIEDEKEPGQPETEKQTVEPVTPPRPPGPLGPGDEGPLPEPSGTSFFDLTATIKTPPAPPPFTGEAKVVARIASEYPGEPMSYQDPWDPEWEGKRVDYSVRYVSRKGRKSAMSSEVSIEPVPPIGPPAGLEVASADGFVRIRWSPDPEVSAPTKEETAEEPDKEDQEDEDTEGEEEKKEEYGFNVYRRGTEAKPEAKAKPWAKKDYRWAPLNTKPLKSSHFEDRTATFGTEWCYVVRTILIPPPPPPPPLPPALSTKEGAPTPGAASAPSATEKTGARTTPAGVTPAAGQQADAPVTQGAPTRRAGQTPGAAGPGAPVAPAKPLPPPARIESADSLEVCLTPADTFSPETPTEVVALELTDGILVSWKEVDAEDLAGYLVYRASGRRGAFERVTPEPIQLASFTDRDLTPGETYRYVVTAVDSAEPPNESSRSSVATALAPEQP